MTYLESVHVDCFADLALQPQDDLLRGLGLQKESVTNLLASMHHEISRDVRSLLMTSP